ncbi:MAG: tyrosine-type recombinase/integrase, partial [Oscillochloris sp.]|nr:tyrosine-type recombinase/integrase [Oscillochloris sp.]
MSHPDKQLEPTSTLEHAAQIWISRLASAGLDPNDEADDLDESELQLRDEQRHHAQRTIESYQVALTLFVRWATRYGRLCLGDLQLDDLLTYTRMLRRRNYDLSERAQSARDSGQEVNRLSPRTIHAYVRPLLGFLALADSASALGFRVAALQTEINRALPRLPDPIAPTPPDLRRLATYYDKSRQVDDDRTDRLLLIRLRNAALLHLLFSSGARISEALSLDVGDVCRDRRILQQAKVYGKGRREGALFIRRPAERALRRYLEMRGWPAASAALFESLDRRTAGSRLSRVSGWRIVHGAAEALADQVVLEGKIDEAAILRATS